MRRKELEELRALYARVVDPEFPDASRVGRALAAFTDAMDVEFSEPMIRAMSDLIVEERFENPPDFDTLDLKQQLELKKELRAWERKGIDGQDILQDFIVGTFVELAEGLPKASDPSPFTIPMVYALPNARVWMSLLCREVYDSKYVDRNLFKNLRRQLHLNLCAASDIEPYTDSKKKPKHAYDSDLPLDRLVDTYLRRTPFHALLMSPVPLKLTHEDRFNHMHVLAGSGQGKTVLIENLIRHDLAGDDPPSIVLIDPHSDLVRKLVDSDLGIEDRLILIDPRDTKHPVALNPFAVNRQRLNAYDEATREQVTAGVIQTFGYLFSGLTSLTLTGKQDVFFRYVTRLMLSLPDTMGRNATILDMLRLMQDPAPYKEAIEEMPEIQREFFTRDFVGKTFEATKDQIRYRLQAIIENPTMARLLNAPETKVDLFTEMNRGAVILVDTAKDFLKEGSATFGKLIISLVLQAVLERAAIPEGKRKPTFLMVDEAGSFFSSNIDDLLTEARKYKCGLLLAHQYLDQASGALRASLAANTGTKLASGLSAADAAAMAREMRTTPEFILAQPRLNFAAYIRNVTPQAVSIPVAPTRKPRLLSTDARERLMAANRGRVSIPRLNFAPAQPASAPAQEGDWGIQ